METADAINPDVQSASERSTAINRWLKLAANTRSTPATKTSTPTMPRTMPSGRHGRIGIPTRRTRRKPSSGTRVGLLRRRRRSHGNGTPWDFSKAIRACLPTSIPADLTNSQVPPEILST